MMDNDVVTALGGRAHQTAVTLEQVGNGVRDANGGLALIAGKQRLHGEHLERIIQLVTPEEKEAGEGPTLEELIGGLISRLDNQSAYLKDITVALAKITHDMPLDVVQAIADNFGVDPTSGADATQ
jgi:hypothetical protein